MNADAVKFFDNLNIIIFAVIYFNPFEKMGEFNMDDLVVVHKIAIDSKLLENDSESEKKAYLQGYMDSLMRIHPDWKRPEYTWEFYSKWNANHSDADVPITLI